MASKTLSPPSPFKDLRGGYDIPRKASFFHAIDSESRDQSIKEVCKEKEIEARIKEEPVRCRALIKSGSERL